MLERQLVPFLLCQCARTGDEQGIAACIHDFAQFVNVADYDGRTPLHIAACEGHFKVVELLLKNGANLHLRDRFGNSPLMVPLRRFSSNARMP
jgi:lysophospholipase